MQQILQGEAVTDRRRMYIFLVDVSGVAQTGVTGITVTVSKNGGSLNAADNSLIEISNGFYYYEFSADEIDTLGTLAILVVTTEALDFPGMLMVVLRDLHVSIVDQVWDERLTGMTHNVPTSAGRRLRQVAGGLILHDGVAQAAASNTMTLDVGADANDDFYNHAIVRIVDGTGSEQERIIVDYNGTTKIAKVAPPWIVIPNSASDFELLPGVSHAETNSKTVKIGLLQSATASTATLDSSASSIDEFYTCDVLEIDAGLGEGQEKIITAYNGTTKVVTLSSDWIVIPDATSEYIVEEALSVVPEAELARKLISNTRRLLANGDEEVLDDDENTVINIRRITDKGGKPVTILTVTPGVPTLQTKTL
ncbi:MAG: hypothetical protein FVQ84_08515 [Planctomycetes bacterium]|nr:hypothetical protein [Planctomycetota bacterium]